MARKKSSEAPPAQASGSALADRRKPHQLAPFSAIANTTNVALELAKINEIAGLLWLPASLSEEEQHARILKALDLFESIKPADGLEAMLAAQMVGTHHAAMECLRRAMVPEQTFEGRQSNLTSAQKMMDLYTRQLAALDKHRGKGQQKITVERIQVAPGAQAIVGDVHAGPSPHVVPAPAAALEAPHEDMVPLPVTPTRRKVPR